MSAAAFNIRWDRAQQAKDSLGIEGEVEIVLIDSAHTSYAFTALNEWADREDLPAVYLHRTLHPEFASFCLWHELEHVRQIQRDYGGDQRAFIEDYATAAREIAGIEATHEGFLDITPENLRAYCMLPWEADANLVAWENRMTLLTRRGRGRHTYGPQGTYWHLRYCELDLREIIDVGNQYREGMRNE